MSKLISQLPEDIKVVALQRAKDDIMPSESDNLDMSFFWDSTIEGNEIWAEVYNDNYTPFREFHAKQKQQENNGWISVEDRLPDTSDNVLAILDGERCCMSYFDFPINGQPFNVWGYVYDGLNGDAIYDYDYTPTHWQPLPEPPKN
jgi:hypothetical protein